MGFLGRPLGTFGFPAFAGYALAVQSGFNGQTKGVYREGKSELTIQSTWHPVNARLPTLVGQIPCEHLLDRHARIESTRELLAARRAGKNFQSFQRLDKANSGKAMDFNPRLQFQPGWRK